MICSKDRFHSLRRLIDHLRILRNNTFNIEIIVVEEIDMPSPIDGTVYCHLPTNNLGFGHARKRAVKEAHGTLLVFIDDDCVPLEGWLNYLLSPFESDDISAVGGGVLPKTSGAIGRAIALLGFPAGGIPRLLKSKGHVQESRLLSTGNLALKRDAVEEAGGFLTSHRYGGEDQELVRMLRGRTLFSPHALVYHEQRESIKDVWDWFVRRGKGEYVINRHKKMGRFHALFHPWRWSWSWRILFLIAFGVLFGPIPLIGLIILYSLYLSLRTFFANRHPSFVPEVEMCRRQSLTISSFFWIPIIRLTMDFGREWGRIQSLFQDLFK
ncbi:glycosyltransferase [Deltaproteobacteria bacterium]|nr:glycosyltransferase [Deltaproteobacteria bacterium]